ncbi:BRO-N domain-containing protein [Pseudomonas helleri]|uniref:BRO-N domain-containing protein n=1 Tax=Pseudomonas helleri TaxID=1608996 RepID=UPI003F9BB3B5
MGIELDVLVGHPEHDLLFVATQVARAAGLKNPANLVSESRKVKAIGKQSVTLGTLIPESGMSLPEDEMGRRYRTTTTLMGESAVYQMLLRSKAEQTEPFRRWVTEEVLPTIRKTGKYDAESSTNPIAMGLMVP